MYGVMLNYTREKKRSKYVESMIQKEIKKNGYVNVEFVLS
jgi:hypothetical protein